MTLALQNAMQSFRHELFVSNFKGIPLLQQHGSADNNVPAFHSRLMNLLVSHSAEQASHRYVELDGKGHWFDGVMTTEPLREFYDIVSREAEWPELPESFNVVIADPAGMGPRGGLTVDQLIQPDQLGKIAVVRRPASATWVIKTSNILRFHFVCNRHLDSLPQELIIDNACPLQLPQGEEKLACWLVRSDSGSWDVSKGN